MDLMKDAWIPVRGEGGAGKFQLITYEELLCHEDNRQISLPRDDMELACVQLLICLTQVFFIPPDDRTLRQRIFRKLTSHEFADGIVLARDWLDLDHPSHPFMQTRGVKVAGITPIQKILVGLPEGNNHAFFNEVGEVKRISAACAAIALFNQAANSPSFGGGFKGSLRGGAPITTLVMGGKRSAGLPFDDDLRDTVWRNVLTLSRIRECLPGYAPDFSKDKPTWVEMIQQGQTIYTKDIGLLRGLFWQPVHIELIKSEKEWPCDLLGVQCGPVYEGFSAEKFQYMLNGQWKHPHGPMVASTKKGSLVWKYSSFTRTTPAWTQLTEFLVPIPENSGEKEITCPAATVTQAAQLFHDQDLHLIVGGYKTKQAAVIERRHEMMSIAKGWAQNRDRLKQLVEIGKEAKKILRGKLFFASKGNKEHGLKGIGVPIHETGEKLFFTRTEGSMYACFRDMKTFDDFVASRESLIRKLQETCEDIFDLLTEPYQAKPELIPVIATARRTLKIDFQNLLEGVQQNGTERRSKSKNKRIKG